MAANRIAIRAIRLSLGDSLRDVEERTGINRGFLSQIETGKRGASETTLARLAAAYKVPVEAITLAEPVSAS